MGLEGGLAVTTKMNDTSYGARKRLHSKIERGRTKPEGLAPTSGTLQRAVPSTTILRQHLPWTGLAWALAVLRLLPPGSYRLPHLPVALWLLGRWRG